MLKIQPNSRQIPSNEAYTADKRYNDLLYGVLQEMSYLEVDSRYVNKIDISFIQLATRLNISRQTVSNRFKHLIDLGLLVFEEDKQRYRLCLLDKTLCSLVPFDTLRMLNNTLNQNTISIYVYLLKRYIANDEQPYQVLMSQMKKFIGIATTTTSNNVVITDILKVLKLLTLIDFDYVQSEDNKTNIVIKMVNNVVL